MATILLVDDVALFLELEKSYLQDSGHRLETAGSGEEVLARIDAIAPDLMLLDLFMPGIDGDELCRRLRDMPRWQELPIVMVTAAGREAEVRRCLAAGCDDYLTKPVNKQDLLEKVERLLGEVDARRGSGAAVSLRVQLGCGAQGLAASAREISRKGIYVRSRTRLAVGTLVEVLLDLGPGHELGVPGRIKRVQDAEEAGMGIYLIHPEPDGAAALEALIRACPGAAGTPGQEPLPASRQQSILEQTNRVLQEQLERQQRRILELEEENREFAEQLVHSEELNNSLTNLYVAASKLHSVLDRDEVVAIIKEVVINFVGAEKFALLLDEKHTGRLAFAAGEGFAGGEFPAIAVGEGLLGEVFGSGESYLHDGAVGAGTDDPQQPLAAIPLSIHDEVIGVLAIYRLFTQKESFAAIDVQLFSMLAEHAATALFSARLYGASERKRETYRGVMDLLLK